MSSNDPINTITCVICHKSIDRRDANANAENWPNYWAYSRRNGFEIAYPVCPGCDSNPKHAFHMVDQISRRRDGR